MKMGAFIQGIVDQQKSIIDSTYKSMAIAQGHAEKMTTDFCRQSNLPDDSISSIETAFNEYNKNCDGLKNVIDSNYDQLRTIYKA